MSNGWKIAVVVLAVLVVYLGLRDYQRAKWLRQELYVGWIETNDFQYYEAMGPADPTKPPPPPPDFGF